MQAPRHNSAWHARERHEEATLAALDEVSLSNTSGMICFDVGCLNSLVQC
ncbi:MAG: hypothetical protein KDA91_04330 [Planctomycetaceae bacterium]|nr:hypothetical protein [Planctomycetaceae bacterium]